MLIFCRHFIDEENGKPLFIRLPAIFSLLKLPTKQLISTVMVDICFQKQASFRLFPLIIFSFQFFRYHLGITNKYQWTYRYYDLDMGNVQGIFSFFILIQSLPIHKAEFYACFQTLHKSKFYSNPIDNINMVSDSKEDVWTFRQCFARMSIIYFLKCFLLFCSKRHSCGRFSDHGIRSSITSGWL